MIWYDEAQHQTYVSVSKEHSSAHDSYLMTCTQMLKACIHMYTHTNADGAPWYNHSGSLFFHKSLHFISDFEDCSSVEQSWALWGSYVCEVPLYCSKNLWIATVLDHTVKLVTHIESHVSPVSLLESVESRYIKAIIIIKYAWHDMMKRTHTHMLNACIHMYTHTHTHTNTDGAPWYNHSGLLGVKHWLAYLLS